MNFSHKEYLPNSERRIEYLRRVVRGRPVAILAAGPSIYELEKRITALKDIDICYFGMNNFPLQENNILQKIGKRFSLVVNGAREGMPEYISDGIKFLDRNEDNVYLSTFYRDTFGLLEAEFDLDIFLKKYDKKLIFVSSDWNRDLPDSDRPLHFIMGNTLLGLINMALIGGASRIILFGADGYCPSDEDVYYYRQNERTPSPRADLINDTNKFFNPVAQISVKNILRTYALSPVDILNCSPKSFYTPFPKINYDSALKYVSSAMQFMRGDDLRVLGDFVINERDALPNSYWQQYGFGIFAIAHRKLWRGLTRTKFWYRLMRSSFIMRRFHNWLLRKNFYAK